MTCEFGAEDWIALSNFGELQKSTGECPPLRQDGKTPD